MQEKQQTGGGGGGVVCQIALGVGRESTPLSRNRPQPLVSLMSQNPGQAKLLASGISGLDDCAPRKMIKILQCYRRRQETG